MPALSRLRSLWRNLVNGRAADRELDDELRSYVDLLSDEYRASGRGHESPERRARLQLGGVEQIKERVRDARLGSGLLALGSDVRYGLRLLRRSPSFAIAAIASLALGIGATSAVFGLINAVQLRSLPVPHPDELVTVRLDGPRCCRHTGRNRQVSLPLWREIARHQQAFSGVFAFADTRFNLAPNGEVRYVEGLFVSGDFFPVLGVAPAIGRTLGAGDDRPGCANAGAVISHALWQNEFGGRPDILAQSLRLVRTQHPIVGVMPPEFFGAEAGRRFEVALPLCASGFERPDHWWLAVMGRLKSGWSERLAHAHLATLGPQLLGAAMPPTYNAEQARQFVNLKFTVGPARNGVSPLREQYEEPLWILLAIAALVLIAAAVNVANLSLVRGIAREPEFGLRFALGASRARVFRQLLVEGALVAIAGAAVGLVLARTAQRTVLALLSTSTDRVVLDVGPDWRVFGLTAGLVGLTTLAFALTPALRRVHARHATAAWSRATPGRKWASARELLVAVQVALAVVLVSGAVVFVLTARNLFSADRGFDETNLLFAHVFMAEADHPPEGRAAGQRELTERLRHLPGIAAIAHTSTPPLGGFSWGTVVRVRTAEGEITDEANRNQVSAGYFETMQLALRKGRDFSDHDTPASPRVAVINETFAQKFFPGGQALGQRFAEGDQEFTVIGIVRDSKQYMLRESFRPIAYTAASQVATPSTTIRFVVRAHGTVGKSIEGVRKVVADFSPSAGLRFATGADVVAGSMQTERLMATLSGCFGAIAILLSAVGVFGLVSYTVTSREREIGIRLALGARVSHVMVTVLGRMSAVAGVGLLAGALLTIPASGLATSLLYGVQLTHPRVMALILGTIIGAGLLAALGPVRRALGTDPVIALRAE